MKKILISFLILFSTFGFASDSDEDLFNMIVGKWSSVLENNDFKSVATEEYRPDGTIITIGKIIIGGEIVEEYRYKSKWQVKDGYSNVEIVESSNIKIIPVGHKISDKIISADEKEFTFESSDGVQITIFRIEWVLVPQSRGKLKIKYT